MMNLVGTGNSPERGLVGGVNPVAAPCPELAVRAGGWYGPVKAAGEAVFALVLLVLTGPLLLAAMLLVKLTSRGPALYSQTRLGRWGKPFTIYKVRSMAHRCESLTGACWSKPGDTRVTWLGRWLRRTHIDELPQLWNVLRGDMSLVGPRPERPEFVPQLEQSLPLYHVRLAVRPGVTGLAQVQLPPDTDLESVRLKLAYDLYYVHRTSCWLDLRIHLATVLHMAGVPFSVIREIFALAGREAIVGSYQEQCARQSARLNPGPALTGAKETASRAPLAIEKAG